MYYYLVIFILATVLLEGPPLWRERRLKELVLTAALLLVGSGYMLAFAQHRHILPDLNTLLYAIKPLADAFNSSMSAGR